MDSIVDWWKAALPVVTVVLFVWRLFGYRIRNLWDKKEWQEDGHVVAVDISVAKHARLKGDDEPLSTRVVARLKSDEIILDAWAEGIRWVPREVRKQVFAKEGRVIDHFEPKINSADPREQQDAIQKMKENYYRYWLCEPVPATISMRKSGRYFITT